jgi:predicted TIM-barrel fold metal-dependent hydrolase
VSATASVEPEVEVSTDQLAIVSCDSHVGPRLIEDLRPYCPKQYLEAYDEFASANVNTVNSQHDPENLLEGRSTLASEVSITRQYLNRQTLGHYDMDTRIREMDRDGVAVEVLFHGSQNTEVFPLVGRREWQVAKYQDDLERAAVGMRIYNRWLADFVATHPERFVGLIYPPTWDVDLAVKEIKWGAEHGLRGVNFPAPRPGMAGEYDDPVWEPFWDACEEHQLTLATHSGLPTRDVFGPQAMAMRRLESAGWPARRGMHRLVFGGVFERHPGLNLVLTEQARGWWLAAMVEMDSVYLNPSDALRTQVPKPPSEYMKSNVFIGSSFTPPSEVQQAFDEGFADNMLWGRDYPHGEGTYKYPESDDEDSLTTYYLRWAFGGVDVDDARRILSGSAVRAYHLEPNVLQSVADRIGPPAAEVTRPFENIPPEWAWHLVDVQTGEIAPRV